jgi:hypothetical protein
MSDNESRGGSPSEPGAPRFADDEISLEPLFRILRSYRRAIAAAASVAVALFALFVAHRYLTGAVRHASLEFRATFDGADRGEYPNGLPFAGSDVIADPVLSQVFHENALDEYVTYEVFRSAVFVVQAPTVGLETVTAEYNLRQETDTTPAARARIDDEFRARRALLQQPLYTLDYVEPPGGDSLPNVLLEKALNDVLTVWARYAVEHRRVLDHQIDMPNPGLVRTELVAADNDAIRLDSLRVRINHILASLDELGALPGAELVRVDDAGVSLSDIRLQLRDLLQSSLRPLLIQTLSRRNAADRQAVASYVEGRLFQARVDKQEAVARTAVLENALRAYTTFDRYFAVPPAEQAAEFLNRVLSFAKSVEAVDLPYRQEAVDRIVAAGELAARLDTEVADYEEMAAWIRGERSNAALVGAPGGIEGQIASLEAAVAQSLERATQIYTEISARNLSPGTTLYTVTSPVSIRTEHAAFGRAAAAYGLLLTILLITVVPLACVVHHWASGLARQSAIERARRRAGAVTLQESEAGRPDGA